MHGSYSDSFLLFAITCRNILSQTMTLSSSFADIGLLYIIIVLLDNMLLNFVSGIVSFLNRKGKAGLRNEENLKKGYIPDWRTEQK